MNLFNWLILTTGVICFSYRRLLRYLLYFQQEGYDPKRFKDWLLAKRTFDKRGTISALFAGVISYYEFLPSWLLNLGFSVGIIILAFIFESDPRKTGKLKLNMTSRAKKILGTAFTLAAATWVLLGITKLTTYGWEEWLAVGVFIQFTPLFLVVANFLLKPFEIRVQAHYKSQADRILSERKPFIIGITGSYGKTSTKAILGDLLNQCVAPTYWPRGSINTVMGITRDIREKFRPSQKIAIFEMGAYGIGSIKRLCDFTPPNAAIVTAVGIMHLERFGSPENVYIAKSELPRAVPDDGILVCNGDNPGARRMANEYKKAQTYLYGLEPELGPLDCIATDISFSAEGSRFTIKWRGGSIPVRTPLLGRPAISNALGAFTMACALGADPHFAAAALSTIQPVKNRLSVEKTKQATFIQDAYNSNPVGFSAALEVMAGFTAKRRILMTPGMIELGDQQNAMNEKVAQEAAKKIDMAVIVGDTNKQPLIKGLKEGGFNPQSIIEVPTRTEGFNFLNSKLEEGDVVLIENDLADLYEGEAKF